MQSYSLNLILQVALAVALLAGGLLARRKRYTAHGICQAAVLLINAAAIFGMMWPSFHRHVLPSLSRQWRDPYVAWAAVHGVLGTLAEGFGIYILLVAGTNLLPKCLKFQRWKLWMRVELVLWWLVLLAGVGTFLYWHTAVPLP